jgi:hypothetical protein
MPKVKTKRIHTKLSRLSEGERKLRDRLLEFFDSNPEWPGADAADGEVFIKSTQYVASPEHRAAIQVAGEAYGCHTCLTKIVADRNQPWTGDHNPPTKLTLATKEDLFDDWDGETNLIAQCDECASAQASLVKKLNLQDDPSAFLTTLSKTEQKLILGGRDAKIGASGAKVTAPEGLAIQKEGLAKGCHSCGSKLANHIYHADHLPPAEMLTWYMPQVCERLMLDEVLDFLENPRLRPQCKRCSGKQGGDLSKVAQSAQKYARSVGITVNK